MANQGHGTEKVPGSTDLLAAMLDRGAKTDDFDLAADRLGASFSAGASNSQTTISMSTLTRNLPEALVLTREVIATPLLTKGEFRDEQKILAEALDSRADDPAGLSFQVAFTRYLGADNPFARILTGSKVRSVTLADVKRRRDELINSSNVQIVMAGDLPAKAVETLLNGTIATWMGSGWKSPPTFAPAPTSIAPTRLIFVDDPGAAQTMVRVLTPSVKSADAAVVAHSLLGTVLGGTFTSRLNANLREDKGYTYGVSASNYFDRNFGFLNVRTSVDSAVTGKAIAEIMKELDALGQGVTSEEVIKATQAQATGALDAFSTPQSVVSLITGQMSVGEGLKEYRNYYENVVSATEAELDRVARTAVDRTRAVWVLVGDRQVVLPQLQGLGLPQPEFFTVPK